MKIIINDELEVAEPAALIAAVTRAIVFSDAKGTVEINVMPRSDGRRDPIGWLEYGISIKHPWGAQRFFIHMVQRAVGAEFEFHS